MPFEMDRRDYVRLYGPTTGDRVRLGDTNLLAYVERDETAYGEELLRGFGKTLWQAGYPRRPMRQATAARLVESGDQAGETDHGPAHAPK